MTCIEIFYGLLEDSTSVQLEEVFRWHCRPHPFPWQVSMLTLSEAWWTMKNTIWVLPVRIVGQNERMEKLPYIWDRERNSQPHVLLSLGTAGWGLSVCAVTTMFPPDLDWCSWVVGYAGIFRVRWRPLRSSLSIFHHSAWNVSLLITSHVLLLNLVGEVIPRTNRVTESMTIHFYILANSWRLLQGSSWLQLEYGSIWMASVQIYPIYSNDMMRWFLFGSLKITWHHQILQSRRIEAVLIVPRIGQTRGSASSFKFFMRRNQFHFHLQNTYFSFTPFSSAFLGHRVGHPYLPWTWSRYVNCDKAKFDLSSCIISYDFPLAGAVSTILFPWIISSPWFAEVILLPDKYWSSPSNRENFGQCSARL